MGLSDHIVEVRDGKFMKDGLDRPRSRGPLSSSLEKVPWLGLVTYLLDFFRFRKNDGREGQES